MSLTTTGFMTRMIYRPIRKVLLRLFLPQWSGGKKFTAVTGYQRWMLFRRIQTLTINPYLRGVYRRSLLPYLIIEGSEHRVDYFFIPRLLVGPVVLILVVYSIWPKPVSADTGHVELDLVGTQVSLYKTGTAVYYFPSATRPATRLESSSTPPPAVASVSPGGDDLALATPTILIMKLSFYDPMIGKEFPDYASVNCADWDYVRLDCRSSLADGSDWRVAYGVSAACGKTLYARKAVLRIVAPDWLARAVGVVACRDVGDAVTDDILDIQLHYDNLPGGYTLGNFPWLSPIAVLPLQ